MYLDLLKMNIKENYHRGYDSVCNGVEAWLKSRGFKEDDFSDPVFIDKQKLEIMQASAMQYGPGEMVTIHETEYSSLLKAEAILSEIREMLDGV